MSKAWHSTKEDKKKPLMTAKERKALKHTRKHPKAVVEVHQTQH